MDCIYLDSNATTPLDQRVLDAMLAAFASGYANPSSPHRAGQRARRRLNELCDSILLRLGAITSGTAVDRLILTSGGTESNNLALFGLAEAAVARRSKPKRIIISSIEHPSVSEAANRLAIFGYRVERIHVERNGLTSLDHLEDLLQEPAALVSLMSVNNETGVVQPVVEAARLCSRWEVAFHTDAVQAIAKVPVDFARHNISAMSLTAHKIHGPRGIGGLLLKSDIDIEPIMFGGFQQLGTRPGTEDVVLASGFAQAIELAFSESPSRNRTVCGLRDQFEQDLLDEFQDSIRIIGRDVPRAPHTSNIAFLGHDRQTLVLAADLAGVCCSTGSACASGSSDPSPVLLAMGCDADEVRSAVRFSFHALLTEQQVRQAAATIASIVQRQQRQKNT